MKNNETNTYSYSYSATENEEIKRIREKYEFREEHNSKLEQLRSLDKSVWRTASAISISLGIIGLFLFGFGLSCVLVWEDTLFVMGIIAGVIGIILIMLAMPVYNIVEKKRMEQIAPEIIKLADELMK